MITEPERVLHFGRMTVKVFRNRDEMGAAAAQRCAEELRRLLQEQDEVNMLFPCAASHMDFFHCFFRQEGIAWERVNAFVMDEYLGLEPGSPYVLANFAQEHIFSQAPFKATYAMDGTSRDNQAECDRYAAIISSHPFDMACLGIGETGHLAYNDPQVADFADPEMVKYVEIDERSRAQAVHDGAFPTLASVPRYAMTVTMPVMTRTPYKQVVVPTAFKKQAIYQTCHGPITTACPASILRNEDCILYTDRDGAELLV
ncbi:MAG: 6-phosphogluconolactonase [Aristaeellaceae bacterium]